MNFFRKITLSFRYWSGYLIVAGIASLCFAFIVGAHSGDPEGMSEGLFLCKIFKLLTIPIILYVFRKFDRSGALYFWLNDEPRTDYGHIGLRVKYLPQAHFIPPGMTLPQAYELYGVDYEGLVQFDDKFDCLRDSKVKELSGGERRIAELYMILNSDAEFCILDEPFSNIAPVYDEKIRALIQEQKANKGIIITDHIYEEILRVADDLFLLRDGFTYQIHSRDDLVRLGYIMS